MLNPCQSPFSHPRYGYNPESACSGSGTPQCSQKYTYPFCTLGYYCYDHTPGVYNTDRGERLGKSGTGNIQLRCRDSGATADCPAEGTPNVGFWKNGRRYLQSIMGPGYLLDNHKRELLEGDYHIPGMDMEEYSLWFDDWDDWGC